MSKTKTMTAGTTAAAADVNQNFDELGMLAYAEVTANQGTFTAETDLTGLTVTFTVSASFAAAGRRIRIACKIAASSSVAADTVALRIKEGATQLQSAVAGLPTTAGFAVLLDVVLTPTSGSHTYKLSLARNSGTGNITMNAGAVQPAYILAEAI